MVQVHLEVLVCKSAGAILQCTSLPTPGVNGGETAGRYTRKLHKEVTYLSGFARLWFRWKFADFLKIKITPGV